ncbi:MAG: hypothetical protein JSU73_03815 [candidate division WOR-3 bacterium]|nr:MAG: hypothetical protein JSU73_03815 [candidate division WOR-3 bacterium]
MLLCLTAAAAAAAPCRLRLQFAHNIRCAQLGSDSSGWASGGAGPRLSGFFR